MKKIILFILCVFFVLPLSACNYSESQQEFRKKREQEIIATFENDEIYYYALDQVTDTYHMTARIKPLTENLYTPVQFNGKLVARTWRTFFIGTDLYETSFNGFVGLDRKIIGGEAKNLYYSDNIEAKINNATGIAENQFFPYTQNTQEVRNCIYESLFRAKKCYVLSKTFENVCDSRSFPQNSIKNHYSIMIPDGDEMRLLQKANVLFCYNNANATNEYFIVDNKDGAYLINKPYFEPVLEGYTFMGWYKEPECVNEWDFETDKTPELQYDENEELIFVETKLYAKWVAV